jgi:hypothetical protein
VKALAEAGVRAEFATVRGLIGKGGDKLLPEVSGIDAEFPKGGLSTTAVRPASAWSRPAAAGGATPT